MAALGRAYSLHHISKGLEQSPAFGPTLRVSKKLYKCIHVIALSNEYYQEAVFRISPYAFYKAQARALLHSAD